MSLCVNANGVNSPLATPQFIKERNCIICKVEDNSQDESFAEINYPLKILEDYNPANFEIFLLAKKDLLENDIYQVYDKGRDKRIGWCFPIQALNSTDHDYAENEHFLRYAYIASYKLICSCPENVFNYSPNLDSNYLSFTDFFSESTAVLLISLETLDQSCEFNINEWIPSLFLNGYVKLGSRDPKSLVWSGSRPTQNRLNLHSVTHIVEGLSFVQNVFSDLLAYESNDLFNFFYLYQIIELLLEQVFKIEQRKIIAELSVVGEDTVRIKEILEKIQQYTSEKKRLHLLVETYTHTPSELNSNDLLDACNKFHLTPDKDINTNVCDSLYKVRNMLFHQYRNVQKIDTLEIINLELTPFIVKLLFNFNNEINTTTALVAHEEI